MIATPGGAKVATAGVVHAYLVGTAFSATAIIGRGGRTIKDAGDHSACAGDAIGSGWLTGIALPIAIIVARTVQTVLGAAAIIAIAAVERIDTSVDTAPVA